jgi:flavodoxin
LNIVRIIGIGIGIVIVLFIVSYIVINFDLISYTATESRTLSSDGVPVGRVLVTYTPGLSGAAKESATKIAEDLNEKGYTVNLAGIRSNVAKNTDYDVIVVGGPMYFGKINNSAANYLKNLQIESTTNLGIFGTTGTNQYMEVDYNSLTEQVNSIMTEKYGGKISIMLILTDKIDANCAELASMVIQ